MKIGNTFGSRLDANKGVGPGFDALRVFLSISILCFHSASIAGDGAHPQEGLTGYVSSLLVPAFFAVSGFLVIASAIRVNSLATFLSFRALRILPALFTEVVITALIVGPLVTTLSLTEYFTSPDFLHYFRNLIGDVHFYLPGVFQANPMKAVNGSLWTIRPEIVCYLVLAVILLAKLHKSVSFYVAFTGVLFTVMLWLSVQQSAGPWGMTFAAQAKYFFYFIAGNLFYHLRHYIPFNWFLFLISAISGIALLQFPGLEIIAALPVIYCTVFLGLLPLPLLGIFSKGDYSYGIYLFAYPIQQLVASFPETRVWWLNILIALPITVAVAALSWHWIEKPFLD